MAVGGLACEIEERSFPAHSRYLHGLLSAVLFALIYTPMILVITRSGILGRVEGDVSFWYILASVCAFAVILGIFISSTKPFLELRPKDRPLPRLYARLPEIGTARISHITVCDHYVEINMSEGATHRVLMRFADAVNEMDETLGFCTHRSHWVAADYVKVGRRVGNKELVEMISGTIVPVSKTYRDNLVQAGFIA